jgi:hypothetical protein
MLQTSGVFHLELVHFKIIALTVYQHGEISSFLGGGGGSLEHEILSYIYTFTGIILEEKCFCVVLMEVRFFFRLNQGNSKLTC